MFADGLVMCEDDGRDDRDMDMTDGRIERCEGMCLVIMIITDWHGVFSKETDTEHVPVKVDDTPDRWLMYAGRGSVCVPARE